MELDASLAIAKALADRSRLLMVAALRPGPLCAEEMAGALGLAPSTVSFHLKKLVRSGLVTAQRDQYYTMYRLTPEALGLRISDLADFDDPVRAGESVRLSQDAERVIGTFFADGRLLRMPAQKRKRTVVLEQFAALFEPGGRYSEAEVNAKITAGFDDYCLIRRLLVDEGFLTRESGSYARTSKPPSSIPQYPAIGRTKGDDRMNSENKTLREEYKREEKTAGIFRVVNNVTGTVFLGSALNLHGPLNRIEFLLKIGSHSNPRLQEDFQRYGRENFTFEVVEQIEPSAAPDFDLESELERLEARYEAGLDRGNCYNERQDIRFLPRRRRR